MRHPPIRVGGSMRRGGLRRGHPLSGSVAPARGLTTRAAGGDSLSTRRELTVWNRNVSLVVYVINSVEPLRVLA